MSCPYPTLFSPLRIRNVYIKNRIESAPIDHSGTTNVYTREAYEHYGRIARGGAAIVTLGEAGVHSLTDHAHPTHAPPGRHQYPVLSDPGHRLRPPGRRSGGCGADPRRLPGQKEYPRPRRLRHRPQRHGGPTCTATRSSRWDEDMMNMIADAYADAAFMAQFAGCDVINIHGGHGWLLNQFLSDLNNHRTDPVRRLHREQGPGSP